MSHKPLAIRTARLKRGVFAIPVIWSVLINAPSTYAQIPCAYEVTAIIQAPECPPFGFPPTIGRGISDPIDGGLPNVVGHYQACVIGPDTAFLWIGNEDQFITLPMPPGTTRSKALAISGSQIVGSYDNPDLELGTTGFLYDFETDQFTSLGTLPGGNTSEANAINAASEIVGFWGDIVKGPSPLAFLWRDGKMMDINPDLGAASSEANDINDSGAITGWWREDGGERIAFIWEDRDVTSLGPIPGGFSSLGLGINILNQITGAGFLPEQDGPGTLTHAFLWENGKMIDLGILPGFPRSAGLDISDHGTIVGQAWGAGTAGIIWQNGVMTDLNDLIVDDRGVHIKIARHISSAGEITGDASGQFGVAAVLLTPADSPLADLDGDCTVGVSDLLILLSDWGPCENCSNCPADLDGNCVVGVSDLLILLTNWG